MRRLQNSARILGAFTLLACSEGPQNEVQISLVARGARADAVEPDADLLITLTQADLAFGPLYLCPGSQAGELCDRARLEWTESAILDALSPDPQELGTLRGVSGQVRSWMFDYGFTSLLTSSAPYVSPAAAELGQLSLVLSGEADISGTRIPFEAQVVAKLAQDVEQGTQLVRKSSSDDFDHAITLETQSLTIEFDPSSWLQNFRAADFQEDVPWSSGGAEVTCEKQIEHSCAPDGSVISTRDCSSQGEVCAPGRGCQASLVFEPESRESENIAQLMVSGERPKFEVR